MRDERGLYYHPFPGKVSSRVYVRKGEDGEIQFRMWDADHPEVWEIHDWITMDVIHNGVLLHRKERHSGLDPLKIYDMTVAKALLREEA